jgi:hypothetical protein
VPVRDVGVALVEALLQLGDEGALRAHAPADQPAGMDADDPAAQALGVLGWRRLDRLLGASSRLDEPHVGGALTDRVVDDE